MSTKRVAADVVLGRDVALADFVNLYGCRIGDESKVGPFVEIQKNAVVGMRCKISSHAFICEGVVIEDEVFVGHHVCFTNDVFPRACRADGTPKGDDDWQMVPTRIRRRASIGSGAVILPGVTVGEGAIVGAGSVVTEDVAPRSVVAGNPARFIRNLDADEAL